MWYITCTFFIGNSSFFHVRTFASFIIASHPLLIEKQRTHLRIVIHQQKILPKHLLRFVCLSIKTLADITDPKGMKVVIKSWSANS